MASYSASYSESYSGVEGTGSNSRIFGKNPLPKNLKKATSHQLFQRRHYSEDVSYKVVALVQIPQNYCAYKYDNLRRYLNTDSVNSRKQIFLNPAKILFLAVYFSKRSVRLPKIKICSLLKKLTWFCQF